MTEATNDPILDRQVNEEAAKLAEQEARTQRMRDLSAQPVRDISVLLHMSTAVVSAMVEHNGNAIFKNRETVDAAAALAVHMAKSIILQTCA